MNKNDFENIVVFSASEPGAMGPKDMTFTRKAGDHSL